MNEQDEKIIVTILNKKFNKKIYSGYDPEDVDAFFDEVIVFIKQLQQQTTANQDELFQSKLAITKMQELINLKDHAINTLQQEVENYKKEGYHSQRIQKEFNEIKSELLSIKKPEK